MAPHQSSTSLLRAASFNIASANKSDLPHVAACVAQSLLSCKDILSNSELSAQKDSDAAVALHRFTTQLSSLLQDRTLEGRWAGVVLVKATIEAGAWESLRKSNPWVRNLLTMLKKPDPPLTRCLCILTLTRIFMLTWDYPTLIREITTPSLPTFVSTCLNNISVRACAPQELKSTLESFAQLIPRHPTIFRLHNDAISKLLLSVFEQKSLGDYITDLACHVSVLLHQCEPKGGASEKWEASLISTIQGAHTMADRTFVSIDEDWQSVTGVRVNKQILADHYAKSKDAKDPSDRPVSQFIAVGHRGLISHLRLISAYFAIATSGPVNSVVGALTDMLTRLMAVTISHNTSRTSVRFVQDVSREERDALFELLPQIHIACMEVLSVLMDRYGHAFVSTLPPLLEQVLWIFHCSSNDANVRAATYVVGKKIVDLTGQSFSKQTVGSLRKYIGACCEDLLPSEFEEKNQQASNGNAKQMQSTLNADTFLKQSSSAAPVVQAQLTGLKTTAWDLLPCLLSKLPAEHVPVAVRALMDRTAILTSHKDAIVASTLNQVFAGAAARKANSILPLLARQHPTDPQVEVLLRPRMPIIQTGRRSTVEGQSVNEVALSPSNSAMSSDDEEEEEEEVAQEEDTASRIYERQMNVHETERRKVTSMMRPSNSPEQTDQISQDTAHAEQDLVNWALKQYASGKEPKEEDTSPEIKNMILRVTKGDESARIPPEKMNSQIYGKGKRQRPTSPPLKSDKRRRPSPALEASSSKQALATGTATGVLGQTAAAAADSDDEDFVVPDIVMGGDSEDEDEEDE